MINTFRRVVAAFSLVALISVVAAAPANSAAAPTGVGTTGGSVGLVSVGLGDPADVASNALNALVVAESNGTSIDPAVGTPSAGESINALTLHSAALPALDALTTTPIQTLTTGAQDQKTTQVVDLAALTSAVPGALSGSVNPATLTSIVDTNGARSSLASTLTNLSLLVGALSVDSSAINVSGDASPTASTASRIAQLDGISAINLEALLNALGFSVLDLSPDVIAGLIDQLGLASTIAGLTGLDLQNAGDLAAALQTLQDAIDNPLLIPDLCLTGGLLVDLGTICDTIDLTAVQNLLDSIVAAVSETLAGTALVSIGQIKAGAEAVAKDTVANSGTTITGTISGITIGGLAPIGPIDAAATLAQIQALADQANTALSNVLSVIDPSLANLLTVKLFEQNQNVFAEGDYVKALSSITALALTIAPPDLCALFDNLNVHQGGLQEFNVDRLIPSVTLPDVASLLDDLGLSVTCQVPVIASFPSDSISPQAITAPVTTTALTQPLTLRAASVSSASEFKVVAAPVVPEEPALPRTGMNETLLLLVGGLMAAVALGFRRLSATARVTNRQQ